MKKREGNFDLLRILCTIAVITIHVSATYIYAITSTEDFGKLYLNGILTSCSYNVLSRFAVPCFVMLSGAFILADERNANYKFFYGKTFRHVGIPTLIFSGLYFAYEIAVAILVVASNRRDIYYLLTPIKSLLTGAPFYHMWYLYMMVGVYLLVPVILLFKRQVGEKVFSRVAWIFLFAACLSNWTSSHKLNWDIGLSFQYTGYLMIGYELRKIGNAHKSNFKCAGFVTLGIAVEFLLVALRYQQALASITDEDLAYELIAPFSPLMVVASVLIFTGFSHMKTKKEFGKLSSFTFLIYLFHAGIWHILSHIVRRFGTSWDNRIVLPCGIIVVFIISLLASIIYKKIWNRVEQRWDISNKLCKCIKLE